MSSYGEGSPITFTPDHSGRYDVRFHPATGDSWVEPIIGWAVVVIADASESEDDPPLTHTTVQPVVRDSTTGRASTVAEYLGDHPGVHNWELRTR